MGIRTASLLGGALVDATEQSGIWREVCQHNVEAKAWHACDSPQIMVGSSASKLKKSDKAVLEIS